MRFAFFLTLFWLPGFGFAAGPNLFSQKALVVDAKTDEVLVSRAPDISTPIASITKLMTAMVVIDGKPAMDELIEVNMDDFDYMKGSRSKLRMGVSLTRRDMLLVALMSSENRAAHALARAYPGGLTAFVRAMNVKAKSLGMANSSFADPTGLSPYNVSTAQDLVRMVRAAEQYPLIRDDSVHLAQPIRLHPSGASLNFANSNSLVRNGNWNVHLQKTGYIAEAGNCVVMSLTLASKKVFMVLLDSAGRYSRFGDAHRIKTWMETGKVLALPSPKKVVKRKTKKRR